MTSRERVMKALAFEPTDRVPRDLGGMLSTGISCFAYPDLVKALGLPPRRPKVHDTGQMLALPDLDVLDALGCDVVSVFMHLGVSNAFDQFDPWHPYDFGGRLKALVRNPADFETLDDGTITQSNGQLRMPPGAYVFDAEHGGQAFSLTEDLPRPDVKAFEKGLRQSRLSDNALADVVSLCRRARESTDRAIFFNGPTAGIAIAAHGGLAIFPLLCMTEADLVAELHEVALSHAEHEVGRLLEAIHPYIDIYMVNADDWGLQNQTLAPPALYETLFLPYYRRINRTIHRAAPNVKTFLHSCGAIYDLIDLVIDSGFDILNPVQWTAGGHPFPAWKERCRGRIALWGGGVDTQKTLPFGTVEEVEAEVRKVVDCLSEGGGYVFNSIHNILAEIPAEKVIAMYKAAGERPLR